MMKAAIIGLFNSGSSVLAHITETLGFNLGPPLWLPHFESQSLRSHLVNWWSEPELTELVPQDQRIPVLQQWLAHYSAQSGMVCAKHPLLCLSANDLPLAWGNDVKYIRAYRDLDESIAKLDARGWFKSQADPFPARRIQTTLWRSAEEFFATQDHLHVDFNDLIADPRREIERLIEYLGIFPTDDQMACSVALVRQPQ